MNDRRRSLVVIDERKRHSLWKLLSPGGRLIDPADVTDLEALEGMEANSLLVIYADHGKVPGVRSTPWADGNRRYGVDLALRLRQEPDRFNCPLLLASFERESSISRGYPEASLLLGDNSGVCWLRLPCSKEDFVRAITELRNTFYSNDSGEKLRKQARELCRISIERQNRRYRHRQGTFCAAVRLLLGGIQNGVVPLDVGRDALEQIEQRRKGIRDQSGIDYDFELVYRYLQLTLRDAIDEIEKEGTACQLLLIDDEVYEAGWDVVLPLLLPSWKISFQQALSFLETAQEDLRDYHLILLDHDFGIDAETGLTGLFEIRRRNPFVPVVLFTGMDDPAALAIAIDNAATAYFVKELADKGDRDSDSYYRYFRRMVDELESFDLDAANALLDAWHTVGRVRAQIGSRRWVEKTAAGQALQHIERAIFFSGYAVGLFGRPASERAEVESGAAYRAVGVDLGVVFENLCRAMGVTEDRFSTWDQLQPLA